MLVYHTLSSRCIGYGCLQIVSLHAAVYTFLAQRKVSVDLMRTLDFDKVAQFEGNVHIWQNCYVPPQNQLHSHIKKGIQIAGFPSLFARP